MQSSATTVKQYLTELDAERAPQIQELVKLVRSNIKPGFVETMRWGMISYEIPLEVSGKTYNNQPLNYVAIASQKNYISVYLMGIYSKNEDVLEFNSRWAKSGKKLNMGKACVRFKSLEDADLSTIAWAVRRLSVNQYLKLVQSYGKAN
jgi:hypothetical protein